MPAVLDLLPSVTVQGATSAFALPATSTTAENSVTVSPSTFVIYGIARTSPSNTPTATEVEAGTGAVASASANALTDLIFNGLSSDTTYDFYLVGKSNGEYTSISKITATTLSGSGGETVTLSLDFGSQSSPLLLMVI